MKRITTLFCLTLSAMHMCAQPLQFQRVYGGQSYDEGVALVQMPDTGYLIAGSTGSFGFDNGQAMLVRTDSIGYVQWRKYYGGPLADVVTAMDTTSAGDLILAGYTETVASDYQMFLLKTTADGDSLWMKTYGGSDWDLAHDVSVLDNGDIAVFGQTYSEGAGEGDFFLIRTDADGDTLWTRSYGGEADEDGRSLSIANDGGFFLCGHTESFGAGKKDVYVVRTDAMGDTLWTAAYGGEDDEFCFGSVATADGGIVTVGGSFSNTLGEGDFMIRKADANGAEVNTRIEDGSKDEYWMSVFEDASGNLFVSGYVEDSEYGKEDVRIMRVNQDLNYDGVARSWGSPEDDRAFDAIPTSDGGYASVGITGGFLNRFDDVYLIKFNQNGETAPPTMSVQETVVEGLPLRVMVAPNPSTAGVTPELRISGLDKLLRTGEVEFRCYNAMGQLIASQVVRSDMEPIRDLTDARAGIFIYHLSVNGETVVSGRIVRN